MSNELAIEVLISMLIAAAVGVILFFNLNGIVNTPGFLYTETEEQVFCTADVMECSDGTYVTRIPPECNFEDCPV